MTERRVQKYTPDAVARITDAIADGATYDLASAYAGVSYQTFRTWREKRPEFAAAVRDAEGRAAVRWLKKIEAAADENWQAAAWKLERRYPEQYGRQVQRVEIDVVQIVRSIAADRGLSAEDTERAILDTGRHVKELNRGGA